MQATQLKTEAAYQPESLAGKRVLLTGGTTGIGRATALMLTQQGARVFTFGRHEKELNDAMEDFREVGGIDATIADTARIDDMRRVFDEAEKTFGPVDILINNAALAAQGVMDTEFPEIKYVLETNLLGYIAFAQEAVNRMKRHKRGHIVNVGSMSADVREKGSSVYVATKAGIQGFSEALRKEVNELGIKVTLIEPGATGTDMQPVSVPEQRLKEQRGEMLTAEDVARCILYCLVQPARCDVVSVQLRPHRQEI